jgi:hypothetical protein
LSFEFEIYFFKMKNEQHKQATVKYIPCRSSYNTARNGYSTLKDTLTQSMAHQFSTNASTAHATEDHLHYLNSDKRMQSIYVQKNEIFPGYTLHKPVPSLPYYPNLSRSSESAVATSKRHFASQSVPSLDQWMATKNYLAVIKFVKDVVIDVLKKKIGSRWGDLKCADDTVFLEACAVKNIISYPEFISVNLVLQSYEVATQQKTVPVSWKVQSENPANYAYMPTHP